MYLYELQAPEKFAFLDLAHHIARCDGEFDLDEQKMIENYCLEMGVNDRIYDEESFDMETTLMTFRSDTSRKILLLEILVLIHLDDKYDAYERELVEQIAEAYRFDAQTVALFSNWGKATAALQMQGRTLIG